MSESVPAVDLPMTTAIELPGMRIRENLGVCYGLVVRSMGFTGGVAASFKGLRRGEIPEYTQLLEDSRRHAIDRMSDNARLLGADAIIAVASIRRRSVSSSPRSSRTEPPSRSTAPADAADAAGRTRIASCCTRR